MLVQIKHRFTNVVLFECEVPDGIESILHVRYALEKATQSGADLRGADLRKADLRWADLRGADLRWADLRGADLRGAYLSGADLGEADLSGAYLSGADLGGADLRKADLREADLGEADLRGADLRWADLRGAYLRGAYLSGADLSGADLRGAYLSGADLGGADLRKADLREAYLSGADLGEADLGEADLDYFKSDFWDVLLRAPKEIQGLRLALVEGRVDGSVYEGECACLKGSIANIRGVDVESLGNGIRRDSSSPAEQWFMSIAKGDIPETNNVSKLTVEWLDEFVALLDMARAA